MLTIPAQAVAHLTTAITGPIHRIETLLLANQSTIESWLHRHWQHTPAPLHASVDLRNASFKLAPIDINLFPTGFNKLNPEFQTLCVHAIQSAIERGCASAHNILIVPKSHTHTLFCLESLAPLYALLATAGYAVRIGSLQPPLVQSSLSLHPADATPPWNRGCAPVHTWQSRASAMASCCTTTTPPAVTQLSSKRWSNL